jgi:hypothetical protein
MSYIFAAAERKFNHHETIAEATQFATEAG